MPLSDQLTENDGWKREIDGDNIATQIHFFFDGKRLCDSVEDNPNYIPDNVPDHKCQSCFERTRNLYNSDKVEDAYKDL